MLSKTGNSNQILVLMVDDELSILELSKTFLEGEDERIRVLTSNSANNALKLLEKEQFDALVSDYLMPGINGLELLEILRNKGNNIPFIIFTGKGREEVVINALNLGADRYIQKGGDPESQYNMLAKAIINEVSYRRAQAALREKEEKFRILSEESYLGMAIIQDNKLKYVNKALADILEYSITDILNWDLYDFSKIVHSDDRQFVVDQGRKKQTDSSDVLNNYSFRLISKSGKIKWVENYSKTALYEGRPANFVTLIIIDEYKQLEGQLKKTKDDREQILNSLVEHVVYQDTHQKVLWANDAACKSVEMEVDQLIGKYCYEIWAQSNSPCKDCPVLRTLNTKKVHMAEIATPDGREWYIQSNPVFNSNNGLTGVVEITIEITERKQIERRLKLISSITEQVRDSVIVTNSEYKIIYINKAAENLFGYSKEELLGKSTDMLNAEPKANEIQGKIYSTISLGKVWMDVHLNKRRDGSTFFCELKVSALTDKNDHLLGYIGIQRDVSERKKMEVQIQHTIKELRRSNEDLEEFTSIASHDLSEPLKVISGYLQLLEEAYGNKLDNEGLKYIKSACNAASRMQLLINDLLSLSRVGIRGKSFGFTEMSEILNEALANLQISLDEVKTVVTYDKNLPSVRVDRLQIVQVFQNLIGNAIKFRKKVNPVIHIGMEKEKEEWVFFVKDNGIGIEEKYFNTIFLAFQRLHSRDEYPGTGIGLTICKKIIERHGGRIWVESKVNEGSTFYFSIPK